MKKTVFAPAGNLPALGRLLDIAVRDTSETLMTQPGHVRPQFRLVTDQD